MRRTILSVLLVLMLVSSPFAGTASAATYQECTELNEFFWVLSFGMTNTQCDSDEISSEMQAIIDSEDNQTHLDLYEGLVAQSEISETTQNTLSSYLQDTRTTAFVKAENATIMAIQKGESRLSANTSAASAVHDYYTASQYRRGVERWNVLASQIGYVWERAGNESGVEPKAVVNMTGEDLVAKSGGTYGYGTEWIEIVDVNTVEKQYVAPNGTNVSVTELRITMRLIMRDPSSGTSAGYTDITRDVGPKTGKIVLDGTYTRTDFDGGSASVEVTGNVTDITTTPPDGSSLSSRVLVDLADGENYLGAVSSVSDQVADNARVYASTLWDAEQNGTINASEYVSPYVMAQEWATDYNSTGYWSYAIAMLSSAGLEAPDLNNTGQMTVRYNGVSYDGILMSSTAPNGTWKTDQVYNGSEIAGYQWFITLDGERLELQDEFTLTSMEGKNGESLNSTTTVKYVYQSNNVTEFQKLQEQILELSKQIEERAPVGTGGGATGSGFWPPFGLTNAQAAVGGAAVLGLGALSMAGKGRRY